MSSLRKVVAQERAEQLAQLSPERRDLFERIRALRESIGPIDFDVSEALREIREGGLVLRRATRRRRLIHACAGDRAQVRGVEELIAQSIRSGGGLLLGRRRMPA